MAIQYLLTSGMFWRGLTLVKLFSFLRGWNLKTAFGIFFSGVDFGEMDSNPSWLELDATVGSGVGPILILANHSTPAVTFVQLQEQ